jgi:hypothetical protein
MRPLPTLTTALLLITAAFFCCAPLARAEPQGGEDVSEKIQKQMQKIIELMRKNEQALLDLSTGKDGQPVRVDVTPPDLPESEQPKSGQPGGEGSPGERPDPKRGSDAAKALEELIRAQRQTSEKIPDELAELVRMVPL